ncbi:MAG: tyrosine-type recombinase/integrase [Spirochaetes bacterium]|nr:tyrosine-type recombinase/integrase [Spirochaetota bacterium]
MKEKDPYSLYQRKRKDGTLVFYARFRKQDGSWSSGVCTGHVDEIEAVKWCYANADKRREQIARTAQQEQAPQITLREYATGFFAWDGPWCIDKQASGKRITPRQCKEKTAILENRVLPLLGDKYLHEINRATVREFRNTLFQQGLAGSSINKAISCIKVILDAAEEKEIITEAPKVVRAAIRQKERGILTVEEVKLVFSEQWSDFRAYVFNLLQASTGMRRGECLGLLIGDIHENYIVVEKSYDEAQRTLNMTTKTGRSRTVILPAFVRAEIQRLIDIHPYRDDPGEYLFFSSKRGKPMEGSYALRCLYKILRRIGVDYMGRRIVGHSWRHWYNSILVNAKIPIMKVQQLTGHSTIEMTRQYFHADDMRDVLDVVEGTLFSDKEGEGGNG